MSNLIINPYAFAPNGPNGGGGYLLREPFPALTTMNNSWQHGWSFSVNTSFSVLGLSLYRPAASGEETLRLWRNSDQALLASVAVVPVAEERVDGHFGSPIALSASETYSITARQTAGGARLHYYAANAGFDISPLVTWTSNRNGSGTGFPGAEANTFILGLVDLIVN